MIAHKPPHASVMNPSASTSTYIHSRCQQSSQTWTTFCRRSIKVQPDPFSSAVARVSGTFKPTPISTQTPKSTPSSPPSSRQSHYMRARSPAHDLHRPVLHTARSLIQICSLEMDRLWQECFIPAAVKSLNNTQKLLCVGAIHMGRGSGLFCCCLFWTIIHPCIYLRLCADCGKTISSKGE